MLNHRNDKGIRETKAKTNLKSLPGTKIPSQYNICEEDKCEIMKTIVITVTDIT